MRRWKITSLSIIVALSLMLSLACTATPEAKTVEEFYQINNATIVANGSVGGGTDFAARLVASYWSEATGGPPMLVRVMPGGGGLEGLDYIYRAEADGLVIGDTHSTDLPSRALLGTEGPEFDPLELSYLGFFGAEPSYFFVGADPPYETLDDLRKAGPLKLAGETPGSSIATSGMAALEILGLEGEIIYGLDTVEMALAVAKGELDGYGISAGTGGDGVNKGFIRPFVTLTFERTAWWPDTPAITELVTLTPEQEDILKFLAALIGGKSFYAPPGVPADKLNYLRRTFDKIVSMKPFVRQAKGRWPVWATPLTGEQLEENLRAALGMSAERRQAVLGLHDKYGPK